MRNILEILEGHVPIHRLDSSRKRWQSFSTRWIHCFSGPFNKMAWEKEQIHFCCKSFALWIWTDLFIGGKRNWLTSRGLCIGLPSLIVHSCPFLYNHIPRRLFPDPLMMVFREKKNFRYGFQKNSLHERLKKCEASDDEMYLRGNLFAVDWKMQKMFVHRDRTAPEGLLRKCL